MPPKKVRAPGGELPSAAAALEVQRPAPGPFSAKDLVWVSLERHGGKRCPVAVVPCNRVDDFLHGWAADAGTNAPILRQTKMKQDGSEHRFYLCQRATIERKAPVLKATVGKRGVGKLRGNQTTLKCDCEAKFDVTLYGDGYTLLWLRDAEHNHNVNTMPRFLAPWVTELCTVRPTRLAHALPEHLFSAR